MKKLEVVGFENVFSLTAVRLIFTSTIKNSFNMNCHCVLLFLKTYFIFFNGTHKKVSFYPVTLIHKIENSTACNKWFKIRRFKFRTKAE